MKLYSAILFFLTVLGIFILAHLAVKHLREATIFRQICKSLILINFRLRGKVLTDKEVEEELAKLVDALSEGE